MLKLCLRRPRIWLLSIGFFCKLWERKRSSAGRRIGGWCGVLYPFRSCLQDLEGGGTGGGEGWWGTAESGWLGWLRLQKLGTWSAGTPAEASASSSPLPASGEAVTGPVFHRTVAHACVGIEG